MNARGRRAGRKRDSRTESKSVPARKSATRKRPNRVPPAPDALFASKLPDPSEGEATDIAASKQRVAARDRRLAMKLEAVGNAATLGPPHADLAGFGFRAMDAFGTRSGGFVNRELAQLTIALSTDGNSAPSEDTINAALAVIDGVKPANEVEAMLAAQMAVVHARSMQALTRMNWAASPEDYGLAGNIAVKLARTFTMQLEALAKLRRGGEQVVRVEHVHVYPGGQAIVGTVNHPGAEGASHGNNNQPYGPQQRRALAFADGAALWGADEERQPVPVPSGEGEASLSNPRRRTRERSPKR
jgi:hypothetical protein